MLDHVNLPVSDIERSTRFYEEALSPLGYGLLMEHGISGAGFGHAGKPVFWIKQGATGAAVHTAFTSPDRVTVDAFHEAAVAAGGGDNGQPGLRPEYHPAYYGAFVLDPDGNNIEAVCHSPSNRTGGFHMPPTGSWIQQRLGRWLVDVSARRPSGWIGRRMYRTGPKAHEASFAAVLDWLGPLQGDRCLEIGCGSGVLLERVLAAGAKSAAGLDHSPDMLALTMERNREAIARDALHLKLGDAAHIPWPDHAFDAAFSANMFFFVYEPEMVLAELYRILAPGGRLVIATIAGPLPKPSLRCPWLYPPIGPALNIHTDEEMGAMYKRAGFTGVSVESKEGLQLARGFRAP